MMKPVNDADFQTQVRESQGTTIVLFKAAWCNPCKEFLPVVEQLAQSPGMGDINFVTCDLDESAVTAKDLNINTVPSLVFFDEGVVQDVLVGRHPKSEIRHWINDNS